MTVISAIGQRGLSSRSHWRPASRVRRDLESGLKSSAFRRGLIEAEPCRYSTFTVISAVWPARARIARMLVLGNCRARFCAGDRLNTSSGAERIT